MGGIIYNLSLAYIHLGQRIEEWIKKTCGTELLKNLSGPYHFKFFKGSLPQILLGRFLNT